MVWKQYKTKDGKDKLVSWLALLSRALPLLSARTVQPALRLCAHMLPASLALVLVLVLTLPLAVLLQQGDEGDKVEAAARRAVHSGRPERALLPERRA